MSEHEIRHRFRLALIGYIILALAVMGGLAVNYFQQQDIKDNQRHLMEAARVLLKRDCVLVTTTADVFVDFIKKEIALRAARAQRSDVSAIVRDFDKAEVFYWTHRTLPKLKLLHSIQCS